MFLPVMGRPWAPLIYELRRTLMRWGAQRVEGPDRLIASMTGASKQPDGLFDVACGFCRHLLEKNQVA